MLKIPTLKEMLEARMHFGHSKERSHPGSKKYIFGLRDKIYIINLEKTKEKLEEALEYFKKMSADGKVILFVGTKRQARDSVKTAAQSCDMPYVDFRWMGGTLTNFETIRKSIKKLELLENKTQSQEFSQLTKKERLLIEREIEKLNKNLAGIRKFAKIPDILFIIDIVEESTVVAEAKKMEIPIVGICDTSANPDLVDLAIPANDDSKQSIELIVNLVAQAINKGKGEIKEKKNEDKKPDSEDIKKLKRI